MQVRQSSTSVNLNVCSLSPGQCSRIPQLARSDCKTGTAGLAAYLKMCYIQLGGVKGAQHIQGISTRRRPPEALGFAAPAASPLALHGPRYRHQAGLSAVSIVPEISLGTQSCKV